MKFPSIKSDCATEGFGKPDLSAGVGKTKAEALVKERVKPVLIQLMRISFLSLVILFTSLSALLATAGNAQSVKDVVIELGLDGETLKSALRKVEKITDFRFVFRDEEVKDINGINLPAAKRTVAELLDLILKNTPLTYREMNGKVMILKKSEQNASHDSHEAAAIAVSGKVTDDEGKPMPGVNVLLKGTATGTVTDAAGNYQIEVPNPESVLVFSSIGFITEEIIVGSHTVINLAMRPDIKTLEEVVVIGYGTMKKSDYTGAVGSIDNEQIMERPSLNLSQSMATRVAGLHVQTNSGRPGGNAKVVIRGYNSYNASNDPLYVVDGIIWPDGIDALNPNDVERVDVLKDASSTAIYGTRGSNGVIMITTKRGKAGGQLRYDSWGGINWFPENRKIDVLNSKEWMFIEEEQYKNAPKFDPNGFAAGKYTDPVKKRMDYLVGNSLGNRELFELDGNGIPQPLYDIDWQEMSTRTSTSQGHNLSYTGGDELSNYGFFLGYINDQGILKRSFAKRYNVRAVMDHQIKEWLKVGGTVSFARLNDEGLNDATTWDITREMVEAVPFIPYQYDDGEYGVGTDYQGLEGVRTPLSMINLRDRVGSTNRFGGNTYATVRVFQGLDVTSRFGVNTTNREDISYTSASYPRTSANSVSLGRTDETFFQWSNILSYAKQFNEIHGIQALGGLEIQSYDFFTARIDARDGDDYYKWYNLGQMSDQRASTSNASDYKMLSYFGRLNYNYREKYLVTVTGRYDGSSRFGADNKFAFFPSSAIAWRISEEDFLSNSSSISNLKLRVSYGLTGNSEIGSYRSLANLGTKNYVFGGTRATGAVISRLANPLLRWEKTAEFNIGVDLGLLRDRISLTAESYVKNTTDLLFDAPVPSTSGYTTVTKNIGGMESKGIELTLNTINISKANFSWSSNFNISTVKNTVTTLGEGDEDILYGFKDALILRVGEAAGSFFGYERDGVYGTSDADEATQYGKLPGDVRTVDQNNDGVINFADRVVIGKGQPDFYGGFSNTLRYKDFDFIVELAFWYGNEVFNNGMNSGEARQGIANSFATVLHAWTPDNQGAILEQVRPTKAYYTYNMDSRNVFDGSFLRGKNLSFGYSLPDEISSKWGLNILRISASVQNFFLVTNYIGYDPEFSNYYDNDPISQGAGYHGYPRPRTFILSLNAGF